MDVSKIEKDRSRFKKIIRGTIKENLKKYISHGGMIGRKGGEYVKIPILQLDLPDFRYGSNKRKGVGQGKGDIGTIISPREPGENGEAGNQPGRHILEVDVSLEELALILGEELELPKIEPRGKNKIITEKEKYSSLRKKGPRPLRNIRKTLLEALKRGISTGTYYPEKPSITIIGDDERIRSWKSVPKPDNSAVIFYMMDVSGSMGDEQKEIVRTEAFWIDTWLKSQYKKLETRYIIHDSVAAEVDEERFYRTTESGGTKISSALNLCRKLVDIQFNPVDWNIYCFQFSDGDNWDDDNEECRNALLGGRGLLDDVNLYCYGQVKSGWGKGDFLEIIKEFAEEKDNLLYSE
ncbi:MAG TPA: DUF444 family protein, partial [Candidatus Dojkabacteria bacterium]